MSRKTVGRGHRLGCGCVACRPDASRIFVDRCKCGHPKEAHKHNGCRICGDEPDFTPCGCKTFRQE